MHTVHKSLENVQLEKVEIAFKKKIFSFLCTAYIGIWKGYDIFLKRIV